jgi:prepilin peptidase CpaA
MSVATPFFSWLLVVSIADLLSRRISNYWIVVGAVYCFGIALISAGPVGLSGAVLGALVGMGIFILPYIKGLLGAGDVKLIGVVGLFMGPALTISSILYASIIGGILALIYLASQGLLKKTFGNLLKFGTGGVRIPYAVAISLGALLAFLNPNFL